MGVGVRQDRSIPAKADTLWALLFSHHHAVYQPQPQHQLEWTPCLVEALEKPHLSETGSFALLQPGGVQVGLVQLFQALHLTSSSC